MNAAKPGDTILVFAGSYGGFRVSKSGTSSARITIAAESGVKLTGPEPQTHNFIRIDDASFITLDGFSVQGPGTPQPYDYDYACIAARGATPGAPMHGLTIRDTEVSGCSPGGMYLSEAEGLLLENDDIHDNVLETEDGNGMGAYLANSGTRNVVIRGCRFTGNAGPGIHFNGDASIEGGDGIQTGHLFENNVVSDNGDNGFNMDGVQGSRFVNDVFANNAHHGVRGYDIDAAEGPKANVFVNNTFFGNDGAGVKMTEDGGGHVLFNNVFVANIEGAIVIEETTPKTSKNVDVASGAGLFVNAATENFRLVSGAAAGDAGVASFSGVDAPTKDFAGFARSGAPDAGAFELGSN